MVKDIELLAIGLQWSRNPKVAETPCTPQVQRERPEQLQWSRNPKVAETRADRFAVRGEGGRASMEPQP